MCDFFAPIQMSNNESKVIKITNRDEYEAFKNDHRRGIIFYGAEWCQACQDITAMYTRVANRYHKRIAMAHADIDTCQLKFERIPVFVAYLGGEEVNSIEGADDDRLKRFVRDTIEPGRRVTKPIEQGEGSQQHIDVELNDGSDEELSEGPIVESRSDLAEDNIRSTLKESHPQFEEIGLKSKKRK